MAQRIVVERDDLAELHVKEGHNERSHSVEVATRQRTPIRIPGQIEQAETDEHLVLDRTHRRIDSAHVSISARGRQQERFCRAPLGLPDTNALVVHLELQHASLSVSLRVSLCVLFV